MRYEHLIQINDPNDPLLSPLSRAQLWRGLQRRVEQPQEFLIGVEQVTIVARGQDWLKREMLLGPLRVEDHVSFEHEVQIHFQTAPSAQHQGGSFTMRIEEPSPGQLFVRFRYETALPETSQSGDANDDAKFADYIKAAYRDTDVDAIRWIRELAETGELDG